MTTPPSWLSGIVSKRPETVLLLHALVLTGIRKGEVTAEDAHHIPVSHPNCRGAAMKLLANCGFSRGTPRKGTTDENNESMTPFQVSCFENVKQFETAQRMAKLLVQSSMVPDVYKGEKNLGNAVVALDIAWRTGKSPLAVMQNIYFVHNKPAWSSQFLIACVNTCGRFASLQYRMTGTKGKDDWGCIAHSIEKSTNETLESPEVTIKMAKDEGWYGRSGSKWKTMPELMLRYRAATFFARLYCPDLTMGIHTRDEIDDMRDITSEVNVAPLAPKMRYMPDAPGQTGDDGPTEPHPDDINPAETADQEAAAEQPPPDEHAEERKDMLAFAHDLDILDIDPEWTNEQIREHVNAEIDRREAEKENAKAAQAEHGKNEREAKTGQGEMFV